MIALYGIGKMILKFQPFCANLMRNIKTREIQNNDFTSQQLKRVCLSTFYVYWEFQFGIYIPFFNFLNQNFKKRCNFNIIFPIPYPIICISGVCAPPSSIYILFIILLCIFDNFFLYYRKSVLCC